MKALPNKSPVEGGSEVALIFREHLPSGVKYVKFVSQDGMGEQIVETREENRSTLSAIIPGHPKPELVMLQVLCNGQVVAYTEFEYYQTIDTELQTFYHMLNSNLPGFFPTMGGMGGYGMLPQGGQGGESMSGASGYGFYGGNTMNIAYHLLLGACKWGVESFVSALLRLPGANGLLSMRTLDGRLPEDIAEANNHKCLAEHLMNLRTMVMDMNPSQVTARGPSSQEARVDREGRQKEILEQLDGDQADSPQGRATSVLQALKKVAERCDMASTVKEVLEVTPRGGGAVKESEEKAPPSGGLVKKASPSEGTSVDELTQMMDALRLDKRDLMRKLEASQRERMLMESKVNSLQAELEEAQEESSGLAQRLRDSDRRVRTASPSFPRRGPLTRDQSILSDHGICVSFDEEVSKRRSSSLLCTGNYTLLSDQQQRSITIKLPPEMNVADSLIYETTHIITEDYPPGNVQDVLLRYGDRIVEINGHCVHGLNTHQIDELFRKDDTVTLTVTPKTKAS